jgi:hypothetical protein
MKRRSACFARPRGDCRSVDDGTAQADRDGMRPRAGLESREEVADVHLDSLLREDETPTYLDIRKALCDQLKNLDFTLRQQRSGPLPGFAIWNDLDVSLNARCEFVEPPYMICIPVQDLATCCRVHVFSIGDTVRSPKAAA